MKPPIYRGPYGDKPIESKHHRLMNDLAEELDNRFNGIGLARRRDTAFVLMVFPFGVSGEQGGRVNYISNGVRREDMVALFRNQADYFEASLAEKKKR